ncbi:MAG TPA: pilus assembly protein N-terminal domain-containing protein [Acidobacteriaceae bacterium]|nr:pilus assembly protein N-terminal domain-containing protein [Acidobacteriaceae bacterium]
MRLNTRIIIASLSLEFACFCLGSGFCAKTASVPRQSAAAPGQDAANDLYITVGQSVLVDSTNPIVRIAVGLSDIAEATATSPNEVMVNGKTPGKTSLIVWEAGGGRRFFNVTVRPSSFVANDRLASLRRELVTEFPGQPLRVSTENGLIFLRGTVRDLNSSQRAVQIASTMGKVVNLLYVEVPPEDPQILLKVRFASVDRTFTYQLGLNLFSTGATNTLGTVTTGQYPSTTVTPPSGTSPATTTLSNALNLFFFRPDLNLGATIAAMEQQGVIEVLAEPNVIATNGKQASFLAGGEYPYPVVQGITGGGTGAVTIQFQEFGVRLNFIPTITPRGTIRLQVAPEVSSLDFTNGVQISGFTVPALDVRKVKTEVELKDGQSFAIGGLLDNRETQTFQKIPFIGDIPILGKFFQSISKNKTNTELMVIITPEIARPMPAGKPIPRLNYPESFLPPNSDMQMSNPSAKGTAQDPGVPPPPPTMPVEQLIDSMKPEQPLQNDTMSGAGGGAGGAAPGGGSGGGAAPQ